MSDVLTFATAIPRASLLCNGRYAVMLTAAGSGYSQWLGCAITRWREDVTRDCWGSYVFLRETASGKTWSAGYQPLAVAPDEYAVTFAEEHAVITRRDGAITTTTEVLVAADGDGEVRRLTLFNHSDSEREIEVTTYAELVLAPAGNDAAHPAFSKLFVQTEYVAALELLLATRRRRSPDEQAIWAAQWLHVEGEAIGDLQWDTDRAGFIGRGRSLRSPAALAEDTALGGSTGTVLDPIFSLRRRVRVAPGGTARLHWWTVAAGSRDGVLALAQRYRQTQAFRQVLEAAGQRTQASLKSIGIDAIQAQRFQRLATALLYIDPSLRAEPAALARGAGGPPILWAGGISGDHPIVLLRINGQAGLSLVEEMLRAHVFWADKRLSVDLVVLNEAPASTVAALHDALQTRIGAHAGVYAKPDTKPAVFALRNDQIALELHAGLLTAARIVIDQQRGTLAGQVDKLWGADAVPSTEAMLAHSGPAGTGDGSVEAASIEAGLEYFNGYGGFDDDGREFVTIVRDGRLPPAPWLNVIANPEFGFTATEAGAGYTWSLNSQRNPLTPWANDPVSDPPQEVLYVRDADDGRVWTATASPACDDSKGDFLVRHGQGYSRYQRQAHGIELELLQYVPVADGIKISRLCLRNRLDRARRLSITAFVQWALGPNGSEPAPHIVTRLDAMTGALFARNAWRAEFGERTAFIDLRGRQTSHTGDRTEFLGRHGALESPAALLHDAPLSGRVGAGLDPCGALQVRIEIPAGSEQEIVLLLGDAVDADAARVLIQRYRDADLDEVLQEVTRQWNDTLEAVQVRTPDRATDLLLNRWLLYQTLACRVWARTAYYQASGAFGFRDQLQDVMALCIARPDVAREHILRAAGRQFVEGDVQHWWLPPGGEGVRTRMTDDRLWLPFVVCHYLAGTADHALLETRQPFLAGEMLKPEVDDAFFKPSPAAEDGSLYEHCARAIDVSLTLGAHNLPLFGTGDWNDGMNRVGEQGQGESVWLGWFLVATIDAFAPYAQARGDAQRTQRWRSCAATVRKALDEGGWDGQWYRRGYYDDGTPLGSQLSRECRIDAIAQSWSVIAGGGDHAHVAAAMAALDEQLIRRHDQLALLFTPPFDQVDQDPGYIKAYPPGIRENGGQYTHGVVWSVFAWARMGRCDRAGELFALINPIHHGADRAAIDRYKVEPYVACADVYSVPPHVGRGGWTWYTGSGAWLYRAGLEAILGFQLQGSHLCINPCIPRDWPGFSISYRHGSSRYLIEVSNSAGGGRGVVKAELDGVALAIEPCRIPLCDDGGVHRVAIELSATA